VRREVAAGQNGIEDYQKERKPDENDSVETYY
jgi:hypothetical protein